jgi:hypothetical protein
MAIAKGYKALLEPSLSLWLGSRFRLSVSQRWYSSLGALASVQEIQIKQANSELWRKGDSEQDLSFKKCCADAVTIRTYV